MGTSEFVMAKNLLLIIIIIFQFERLQSHGVVVTFPSMAEVDSQWAWVLAMTGVIPV